MNEDTRLAAAFFVSGADHEPLELLLARVGATDIADRAADPDDHSGLVGCRWAGMPCYGFLQPQPAHRLLVIFFPQSSFLELLPDSPGESTEPAGKLLTAFASGCERLHPDAAVLVTHPDQADLDVLSRLGGWILEADAPRLASQRFGLLYLSNQLDAYQEAGWLAPDRDILPSPYGRLIFAGRGGKRWW